MNKTIGLWWVAALLSVLASGAVFEQVALQRGIESRLSAIHQNLQKAQGSTETINRQLKLIQAIDQASQSVARQLKTTEGTAHTIDRTLGSLAVEVGSIQGHLGKITQNTYQAAQNLSQGVAPTNQLNQLLMELRTVNQTVAQALSSMVTVQNEINLYLNKTNQKIP